MFTNPVCLYAKRIKCFPADLISPGLFSDIDPGTSIFSSKNRILTDGSFVVDIYS